MLRQDFLKHLAIIMDGNGRWAQQRNHKRLFGHVRGARTARSIISKCSDLQIPYLSLFALSTENILRPESEIQSLINLFEKTFLKHGQLLIDKDIRFHILGDTSFFPEKIQDYLETLRNKTKDNKGLNLILALNYGGRQEIVSGAKKLVKKIQDGDLKLKDLKENQFASLLPSSKFPPPDLIIRTGGNLRLSNFYLWSAAYSEFYFTETLWPDFDEKCLDLALQKYSVTERKFGVL